MSTWDPVAFLEMREQDKRHARAERLERVGLCQYSDQIRDYVPGWGLRATSTDAVLCMNWGKIRLHFGYDSIDLCEDHAREIQDELAKLLEDTPNANQT